MKIAALRLVLAGCLGSGVAYPVAELAEEELEVVVPEYDGHEVLGLDVLLREL